MKNQYFADIKEYRKRGLVGVVTNRGEIKSVVRRMLAPDDE